MLYTLCGRDIAPDGLSLPPAIELQFGHSPQTHATLADGSHLTCEGWPRADLLAEAPVFLRITAPLDALTRMSFLALSLDVNPAMHRPALAWAARRTEIAVWCTTAFSDLDARIWANAPERLSHRAYLVETAPNTGVSDHKAAADFTGHLHLALPGEVAPLLNRIGDDIDEARIADLDAAHLLLHRLGHLNGPISTASDVATKEPQRSPGQLSRLRDILSEPTIYLSRRVRALAEDLAWIDPDAEAAWHETALIHCTETAEGLKDRSSEWPDDLAEFTALSEMIDDATNLLLLLQMDSGPDQVEDAAGLLHQMRCAFDQCRLGHGVAA
ncbi:hypothetical protein [Gymnodinialimonas hymeniacidonis]|uniref:hypothetical protein n=1 Tax=Gymnodinialimonas hymeniacidonis TaxID=3126508 RepID=UPI0034C64BD7